jgi:phage baseplate assembly protein V
MLKFGHISEMDAPKGLARVKFDGEDGMVSYWLPISSAGTKDGKFIIPFNVNEHVWCMMDENLEYGVIGGAIYDKANQPDDGSNTKVGVSFVEGLRIEYDRNSKTLTIDGEGDFKIDINGTGKGKVNIKCNSAVIDSLTEAEVKNPVMIKLTTPLVECSGALTATAIGIGAGAPAAGNIEVAGDMNVTGEMTASQVKEGLIRLGTHKHSGVTTGAGTSGTPVP